MINNYIKRHNITTRVIDMFIYYHMIEVDEALEMEQVISKRLKTDIVFVETLAQCFQKKLKKKC